MRIVYMLFAIIGVFLFLGALGYLLDVQENGMKKETIALVVLGLIGFFGAQVSLKKFNKKPKANDNNLNNMIED